MDIIARDIYSKLQESLKLKNAIIAGGAVRDYSFGKEYADIDIFAEQTEEIDEFNGKGLASFYADIIDNLPEGVKFLDSKIINEYQEDMGLPILKMDLKWKDLDVDLMLVAPHSFKPEEESFGNFIVDRFDFGINKIFYDGFSIVETEDFARDKRWSFFTLKKLSSLESLPYYFERVERWKVKYPTFTLNLDEVLELKKTSKQIVDKPRSYFNFTDFQQAFNADPQRARGNFGEWIERDVQQDEALDDDF